MKAEAHRRRRQRSLDYARMCGVSAWVPAGALVDAAEERTAGMVALYMHHGARAQDLPVLVRSAYLQGAQDAAMVAAQLRLQERTRDA